MPALTGEITETITFEFEVFCKACGNGLCNTCEEGNTQRRKMPFIRVGVCDRCESDAYDRGFESRNKEVWALEQRIEELEKQS